MCGIVCSGCRNKVITYIRKVIKLQYKRVNLMFAMSALLLLSMSTKADDVVAMNESVQQPVVAKQTSVTDSLLIQQGYQVQPGDVLHVSVWHEPDLQLDVLISPSGNFSLPLIGQMQATNKTLSDLQKEIATKLDKFVPGADVMVALKQIQGNKVYVIGKVNRPGEFVLNRNVDVMQVLSMAGGMNQFANQDGIIILRRENQQAQKVYPFDYDEVKKGENLTQNIILKSGDVVVVP